VFSEMSVAVVHELPDAPVGRRGYYCHYKYLAVTYLRRNDIVYMASQNGLHKI